ncbi:hypothetical protein [Legionella micdadei]|uniref:PIN domain-containing protein n=4 Tax=Legionella micdadei TaxID=451 RepID=A0A098GIZ2_LEGMI|nr:hypothetical protein [Legionella micdadei]ARG97100.1 hypothetical protein B6N58_05175 [Legionella micdadei]KTD29305.1 hypothetical protein Lmic_1225 [Legionella micdadei]CEG61461.1 protein of unknown function [Legionella micdadei]SCY41676.1 hypothetical protein SAMN02982997_01670 [Legionella micdadei]
MKTAFIETSAINWLYDNSAADAQLTNHLFSSNNFIPVVGMDTIYEMGRCFKTNATDKASALFTFLKQLNPIYYCQRSMLYNQELDNLLHGSSVIASLGHYTAEILAERIKQFSLGIFDSIHEEFISGRQFFWDDCREKLWKPEKNKKSLSLTFDYYLQHCLKQIESNIPILQKWLEELTGKKLPAENAVCLMKRLGSYPALRTSLYSQFYLNYLIIRNQATPSEDKFTDSLQLIGASYSSAIVSHDNYLLNTLANALNPDIQIVKINSLNETHTIIG